MSNEPHMKIKIYDGGEETAGGMFAELWKMEKRLAESQGRPAVARMWTEDTGWVEITDTESEEAP